MPRHPKTGRWCSQAALDAYNVNAPEVGALTRVFVFGTLKKGYGNHWRLQHLVGVDAVTKDRYQMQAHGIPFVLHGDVAQVRGEVYECDAEILQQLDQLEGYDPKYHGQCAYNRTEIDVLIGPSFTVPIKASIYLSVRDMAPSYSTLDEDGYLNWTPTYQRRFA